MKFFLPDQDETIEDAREITGKFQPTEDFMAGDFARDAAEYLNREMVLEHKDFPALIAVVGKNGNELGTFKVFIVYDPTFYAERIDEK